MAGSGHDDNDKHNGHFLHIFIVSLSSINGYTHFVVVADRKIYLRKDQVDREGRGKLKHPEEKAGRWGASRKGREGDIRIHTFLIGCLNTTCWPQTLIEKLRMRS